MQDLLKQIMIRINENIYVKDPESSDLGKSIIRESILMIDELGLEHFTFKKLAEKLSTVESSIYRYFENKHKLLIYLNSWYWGWMEYRLVFSTVNIQDPVDEWKNAIKVLSDPVQSEVFFPHINFEKLNHIIISESPKVYLTKDVDEEKRQGFYAAYDRLCDRLCGIVHKIRPEFQHARTLCSTMLEGIQRQKYFIEHLPSLTDISRGKEDLTVFFTELSLHMILNHNHQ